MKFSKILVASALFLGATLALQGQTSGHFFRTLAWQNPVSNLFYSQEPPPTDPASGTSTSTGSFVEYPVEVPTVGRSTPYKFDPSKPIYFFLHKEAARIVLATVDAHDEPILPLLFFQKEKGESYRVTVMPDNANRFPGGNFRILNLSHLAADLTLSDKAVHLEPRDNRLLAPSFRKEIGAVHISIKLTSGQTVYTNNLHCQEDLRYLLFLVDDPNNPNSVIFLRLLDSTTNAVEPTPPPKT